MLVRPLVYRPEGKLREERDLNWFGTLALKLGSCWCAWWLRIGD